MSQQKRETRAAVAIRLRDAILKKLRQVGQFQECKSGERVLTFATLPGAKVYFRICLRTPFQRGFLRRSDDSVRRWVTQGLPLPPEDLNLPYGLDVWTREGKRLNIEWSDNGRVDLVGLRRGEWEEAVMGWASDTSI